MPVPSDRLPQPPRHWLALALLALAAGVAVYLVHRPAGSAQWLPWAGAWAGAAPRPGPWAGALVASLPSAVHAFAFALLTAAALPTCGPWRLAACAAWAGIDALAEAAQHPALREAALAAGQALLGPGALEQAWSRYLRAGRFDTGDLVAVALGATAAALIVVLRRPPGAPHPGGTT